MDRIGVSTVVESKRSHDRVTLEIENREPSPVAIRIRQPLRAEIPSSHVTVPSDLHAESWTIREDTLEFVHRVGREDSLETGYAVYEVDRSALSGMLGDATLELREMDGTDLGTVTDLRPRERPAPADTRPTGSQPEGERTQTSPQPEGETDSVESSAGEGRQLPATISDFVLADVAEDIQPAEFEWTTVDPPEQTTADSGHSGGLLSRLLSWF